MPGEVTVGPNGTAITTFTFDQVGVFEFACHLPGHYEHGMRGEIVVVAASE
ncbi:MAG: multicopper oxidase domain-containing protein [Acidimicrobiia bacterium]